MFKNSIYGVILLLVSLFPMGGHTQLQMWSFTGNHNFGTVEKEVIYRSGRPSPEFMRRVIRKKGIRTIFVLARNLKPYEKAIADEMGVKLIHYPMLIRNINYAKAERVAAQLKNPANHPVWVYCEKGIDRTGFVVALFRLIGQDRPLKDVFTEMLSYNFRPANNPKMIFFLIYEKNEIRLGLEGRLSSTDDREPEEILWEACHGILKKCSPYLSYTLSELLPGMNGISPYL